MRQKGTGGSPEPDRSKANRRLGPKRPDTETDNFIKFLRENQLERQPTHLRLQKRVPLPGIGQLSSSFDENGVNVNRSPRLRTRHNLMEDYQIDNEIAMVSNVKMDPRKDPMFKEMLSLTRERTKDHIILHALTGGNCDINSNMVTKSDRHISRAFAPNQPTRKSKHKKTNKHLPPLILEDFPDRPGAPSPSRTPPYADSSAESNDEPTEYS